MTFELENFLRETETTDDDDEHLLLDSSSDDDELFLLLISVSKTDNLSTRRERED